MFATAVLLAIVPAAVGRPLGARKRAAGRLTICVPCITVSPLGKRYFSSSIFRV
jgi:hypothetical protein